MTKKEDAIKYLENAIAYSEPMNPEVTEVFKLALEYMRTDGDVVPYKDYKDLLDSQTKEEIVRCADCRNYVFADDVKPDPNCQFNYCWLGKLNHPTGNMYCYFAERR